RARGLRTDSAHVVGAEPCPLLCGCVTRGQCSTPDRSSQLQNRQNRTFGHRRPLAISTSQRLRRSFLHQEVASELGWCETGRSLANRSAAIDQNRVAVATTVAPASSLASSDIDPLRIVWT